MDRNSSDNHHWKSTKLKGASHDGDGERYYGKLLYTYIPENKSMAWFKGKSAGFSMCFSIKYIQVWCFPVDFPFHQSNKQPGAFDQD
jgi:hypothetical protein